jgi:hypothetical protein
VGEETMNKLSLEQASLNALDMLTQTDSRLKTERGNNMSEPIKYQLRYMLIGSCYDCNQRGVKGDGSQDVCCITGTDVTHHTMSEEEFPEDCPLKVYEEKQ